MSNSEPILSEFLTKEELAAELRRNPRTLDRWDVLGMGPPRTHVGPRCFTAERASRNGSSRKVRKSSRPSRTDAMTAASTPHFLQRQTLQTFRLLDFCSERELGRAVLYGDLVDFLWRIEP